MVGDKGDMVSKKQTLQQHQQSQKQQTSPSSKESLLLEESTDQTRQHHYDFVAITPPFITVNPLYVNPAAATAATAATTTTTPTSSSLISCDRPFDHSLNPKRTRYTTTGQWTLLPSTTTTTITTTAAINPSRKPLMTTATTASSSDTTSSPSHKSGGDHEPHQIQHQFRKGKYVSPVWKPNEMLWLARAWREQYSHGSNSSDRSGSSSRGEQQGEGSGGGQSQTRGRTRADKDRQVAEFLQKHGVNRDAKTTGTKWDNMLGEFRKVYEWERGGGREQVGKSYFRLSPYERKLHRLPASFDEDVFEELSQFMGSRMRSSQSRGASTARARSDDNPASLIGSRALPPPPLFKDDDLPLSARTRQLAVANRSGEPHYYGSRGGSLGFDHNQPSLDIMNMQALSSSSRDQLGRIGKIRMIWEESVSLWAEDGEHHSGRVRLHGSSFLNADELTFFDDSVGACTMEAFEDGPLTGFSVDRFVSGQQVRIFGRRKSPSASSSSGFTERVALPTIIYPSLRSIPPWEYHDPTEYYLGCLKVGPPSLPTLFELSWHLQESPPEELRFPLRKDVYRDIPQGKEFFFTTSTELLDCRSIIYDILGPIIRPSPIISSSTSSGRDSYIPIWDDCINRVVSKFCSLDIVLIRKPSTTLSPSNENLQDQWPNVMGFIKKFCLWRGEEIDQLRDGHLDPSSSIVEKLLWTYTELPYILGYYAIGYIVTFCALSRVENRVIRTDLYSLDLSSPTDRLKALVPCYRIAGLLPLLVNRCNKTLSYNDFERIDLGNGIIVEMTPNTVTRVFSNRRKWAAVKEVYDFLDHRIPHGEFLFRSSEIDLALVFKPRGCKIKPTSCEQLIEALKSVTKSLVALHDLCFMHRDISWDKVMKRNDAEGEWFICGFDEAAGAPQIYPHGSSSGGGVGTASRLAVEEGEVAASGRMAPEMERGLHGVKVDVWGVGYLIRTCGLGGVPKMLRELQNRCMDQSPDQRPSAADCYHHLLQLQSSLSANVGGVLM